MLSRLHDVLIGHKVRSIGVRAVAVESSGGNLAVGAASFRAVLAVSVDAVEAAHRFDRVVVHGVAAGRRRSCHRAKNPDL